MAGGAMKGQPLVITYHKSLQTLFAKHMETLQQFRFSVGVKTDTTGELIFQFPESLFSNSGGCGHCGCEDMKL